MLTSINTVKHKELYSQDGVFSEFTYGIPAVSKGFIYAYSVCKQAYFKFNQKLKILVVGAGVGYEVVQFVKDGHKVRSLDLWCPDVPILKEHTDIGSATEMPYAYKSFDVVFCCEMLEHIEENETNKVLKEFARVADHYFISIATADDFPYCTHINVKPAWWWIKKFEDIGFTISGAEYKPKLMLSLKNNHLVRTQYPEGVLLYGNCYPP